MEKLDVIKTFLYETIPDMVDCECNLDFIKFLFKKEDIEKLENIVINYNNSNNINEASKIMGFNSINLLYETNENPSDTVIRINNFDEFFDTMTLIFDACGEKKQLANEFIRSVWLRMGVEDLNNVEMFLKRQLEFLKNDTCMYYDYYRDDNMSIACIGSKNPEFFETNSYARFIVTDDDLNKYRFPVVHYGISKENNNPICYVYGVQNAHTKNEDNEEIDKFLKPVKKGLRNKYVSKDFVLTLGMFLDMMYERGIEEIRIPLLQVFNYEYHEKLSTVLDLLYNVYDDEEKEKLEDDYIKGIRNKKINDYIDKKLIYDRFFGKEDIISYNKTERFINTFMVLNDVFDNIEICNEPFIQGDELIVKIKKSTNIREKLNEKNKEYSK